MASTKKLTDQDLNGNKILNAGQVHSVVPKGTAPMTVISDTVVEGLNADMLDGKHAKDFALKTEIPEGMVGMLVVPHIATLPDTMTVVQFKQHTGVEVTSLMDALQSGTEIRTIDSVIGTSQNLNTTVPVSGQVLYRSNGSYEFWLAFVVAASGAICIKNGKYIPADDRITITTKNISVVDANSLLTTMGTSSTGVMSQKAVTDAIRYRRVRRITVSTIAEASDYHILCVKDSGTLTLTLPSSPQDGQEYHIIKQGTHTLNITSSKKILMPGVIEGNTITTQANNFAFITLLYSSVDGRWYMMSFKQN